MYILISRGFGSGWSTWHTGYTAMERAFMLTHKPTIDALLRGDTPYRETFKEDFLEKFGDEADLPYMGGWDDLCAVEVDNAFIVEEYDGSESLRVMDEVNWWIPMQDGTVKPSKP